MGDSEVNYSTLPDKTKLARCISVLFVKSLANPLSYSFATFVSNGITSGQLFPIFWRAVAILEITCGLNVIAWNTADGASPNRKFVRIHKVSIF